MAKKTIEEILGQHFGVSTPTSAKRVEVETEFGEIIPVVDTPVLLTERRRIAQGIDGIKQALTDNEEQKRKAFISSRPTGYDGVVQGAYGSHSFGNPQLRQQDGASYTGLKADQQTTNVILGRAQKALDTYTEQEQKRDIEQGREKSWFSEFLGGLGDTNQEDVGNILFMDLPSISHTGKINNILEKESKGEKITDTEQLALNAYKISLDANQVLADEGGATTSTAIGQSLPANIGYAAQTFGTGGMLGITRNIATNGVKALGVALAAEAARTPMRGAMYKNFQNRTSDQYSIKDDGAVVKDKETSPYERIGKSYASTFTEGATEHAGNLFGVGLSSKLLKSVAPRLLKTKFGSAILKSTGDVARSTKAFREGLQKATGYNNIPAELLEEEASNIIEPLLTGEPERLGDNFTVKNQLITLGSVAAFGGVMQMSSFPSIATAQIEKHSMRRSINKSLSSIEIPELRQQVYDATKKNMSIEGRAHAISALDWKNLSAWDRAHAIDAFQGSIALDQYNGFELSRKTDEMTAQKIQTWNAIYQQSANTDTGAIEELADEQDNRYLLLAGSLEDQGTDETLFVRNAQTGMTEQIGRSSVRRVGDAETYQSGLRKIVEQSATQASEQILADQSAEEDQDAQEIGVQPVSYNVGDNVVLADGRQGQFLGYHNDGSNIAQVAFVDQQTGEQESAEVPKSQIVGFAYQDDVSQAEPAQELPNVEQSEQSENAQQEVPSENVQQEIPTTKDGEPDYDAMPADMYLAEYSKVASFDEALEDLRNEKVAIEKQIKKLQSSNNAISRNTKIANRGKVATLQAKVDDIGRVLQENAPTQPLATQIEQISSPQKQIPLKEAMLNLGDCVSVEDYILRDIASGLKFRWADDGVNRGLATELGFKGSDQERKSRIGVLRNDGTTIDKYAESISGLLGNSIPAFNVDEQDIRNAVIDVLGSVSSPAQAATKVKALHSNNFDEQAEDYYLGELEKYKVEVSEYDTALDLWVEGLGDAYFLETDVLFESELLTLRDQNTSNDGYNQANPRRASVAQDATIETSQDKSRGRGDNDRGSDQKIDFRGDAKEADAGQDDQRVEDPIFLAQTQEQKYEAVKDYVDHLNQLSGANAVVFSRLEQLPDDVAVEFEAQWRADIERTTPGVMIKGDVYIYAPHIESTKDLVLVYNHEVVGHKFINEAIKTAQEKVDFFNAIVDHIGTSAMRDLKIEELTDEVEGYENGEIYKWQLGREYIAYLTKDNYTIPDYDSRVKELPLYIDLSDPLSNLDLIKILKSNNNGLRIIKIGTGESTRNGLYDTLRSENQQSADRGRNGGSFVQNKNSADHSLGEPQTAQQGVESVGQSVASWRESEAEIWQEDVRGASGAEQTDGTTDARPNGINPDIRYRQIESDNTVETEQIRQQAIERGDFLKAPNGEPTNLTERQWLQVRTAAFKEWFGDWDKAARIEKLRNSSPVEITGEEITPDEDLKQYKRNALEYGKTLRGEYVNKDTGEKIVLHRSAVKEVLNHDYKDFEHLQSIAAIPQIIEQSIYITTASNEDVFTNPDVASYDYYVCGLNAGDLDYTVRAVVATKSDGKRYYDHKLSAIEKGKLIEKLTPYAAFAPSGLSSTVGSEESTPFRPADKSGETSKISHVSDFKDKRLLSILQTNSSKVVNANGEPMVVYHGTDSDFYEFNHDKISNLEGSFFFAQNIEDAEGYSTEALIEAFVNLRNPANFEDLPLEVLRLNDKKAIVERLKSEGYDGWVEGLDEGWGEISAFNPNQIKSAIGNTGDFSKNNDDIRYSDQSLLAETQSQHEYEQNKANTYVNAEKRKTQVVGQLQKLTEKFGVETVIVDNTKELPQSVRYRTRNSRFGGLYDKQDGKVYFVSGEIKDADDATATFLHEVVSHKGIDALMGGEKANQFYASVFDSLPQKEQARLLTKYDNKVEAGDELVARMAEGNVTPSVMQRVIAAVRKFFREVLGLDLTISDNDIRYVLWKSKNNLERASTLGEVFSVIERDKALRSELYPPHKSLMDQVRDTSLRYRNVEPFVTTDKKGNEYLRVSGTKGGWGSLAIQAQEAVQDETIKVHLLQKEIKRRGGQITALTNVYEAINHRDSIADAQMVKYGRRYIKPFIGLITELKDKGVEYGDVSTYLLAKHSIERHLSGTSALSDDAQSDWTLENTSQIVEEFESKLSVEELANLWQTWRKATERIIDIAVQSGRMSLESREAILARWRYYVPLRGKDWTFEGEENLADIFYADRSVGRGKSPSKKVANIEALGRTSKAADPISTLQNMANTEIYLSAANNVNRSLLRLVNQYQDMADLFELKERWYVKKGESWYASDDKPSADEIKTSSTARITKRKLERELAKTVNADKRAEKERQIEDVENQITVSRHERDARGYNGLDPKAGEVVVMKDGVKYVIEMGDVEVAKAVNGNTGSVQRWLSQYPGRVTRVMSQLSTSKNPAFILPNLLRDFQQAALYNFVDQDGNMLGYMRNMTASWATLHRNITDKAYPLTVAEMGEYDILKVDDRRMLTQMYGRARIKDTMCDLFVMNGGETGYVHILEPAEYQRKLEKEIRTATKGNVSEKSWKALNNGVDYLANMSENAVRFATFMSQIEKGSNVFDAVSYAKNITVNFNRKGKYSKGVGALFMFFNAGVQGATNTYSLWGNKNDRSKSQIAAQRVRFVLANSMLAAIGYVSAAIVYEMLSSMVGDDGEEFQISDYERRTNLIIPAGTEKGYIKIPIPILFRPFYSLGVMTNDWVNGKIEASDLMGAFSQSVVDAVSPLQVGYSLQTDNAWALAKPFIPSSVKPLAEIGYNQNFLGRPINREAKYNPDTPDSELGQKNVNEIALAVSRWLNKLGGGNTITPAGIDEQGQKDQRNWLDISPSTLEHIVTSYTGGVGKMINETYVTLTGDQSEARKIPIANRFYGEAYEKDPSREYYDIKKNIERVNRNNKKAKELGARSAIFTEDEFPTKYVEYENYGKAIKELERKTRPIKEKLGQMQPGSQEYDLLKNQMDKLHRKFIKQYNDQRD